MDPYCQTLDYLLRLPPVGEWPALQSLLERLTARQPLHWGLPLPTCAAVGANATAAIPAMAAIACLHSSLALVDDMLDDDSKGEYQIIGEAAAANLALALQALGLAALASSPQPPDRQTAMMCAYTQAATMTALGQEWDVQGINSEAQYWQVMHYKGAPFFGLAFALGAWSGGAEAALVAQFQALGCHYGTLIQLHDDLSDSMAVPAEPDWLPGRATLPLLYAQTVSHVEQPQFVALRTAIPDPAALAEAQAILLRCGAVSHTVERILHHYQLAQQLLAEMKVSNRQPLAELLAGIVKPVGELLALAGVDEAEAMQIIHQP